MNRKTVEVFHALMKNGWIDRREDHIIWSYADDVEIQEELEEFKSLVRFGEPLDKSEVGSNFDARLIQVCEERKALFTQKDKCGKLENRINTIFGRLTDRLKKHTRPEIIIKVQLVAQIHR